MNSQIKRAVHSYEVDERNVEDSIHKIELKRRELIMNITQTENEKRAEFMT